MEHRILIRKGEKVFKVFKLVQHANSDITIIPYKAVYLSGDFIERYDFGEKLRLSVNENDLKVDHFSAHSATGQRHIKFDPSKPAVEPIGGAAFKDIKELIPLATILASTNVKEDDEPKKGKWSGMIMPEDTDYCIFDVFAIPFDTPVNYNIQHTIENTKQSVESMFTLTVPLRDLGIAIIVRTSNHNHASIPVNVFIQQRIGKTAQIVRVDGEELDIQISRLRTQ